MRRRGDRRAERQVLGAVRAEGLHARQRQHVAAPLVGLARAKEMVLRGKPVPGEKAAVWGLVSECVGEDELDAAVTAVAGEMAAAATVSARLAKILLHRNLEVTLATALQNEAVYEELDVRSDDFKEGMRSFADRRPPSTRAGDRRSKARPQGP